MTVVTLTDFQPGPRTDGVAWTNARIEESLEPAGPWTTIDTVTLSPVDANPAAPLSRDFTTTHGTLAVGWYRVVFTNLAGDQQTTDAVLNTSGSYTPSVNDLGALIRARTKDTSGDQLGTFTALTRPTDQDAERIIGQARNDVTDQTGDEIPQVLWRAARSTITYRAAMLVELGYFPEQIGAGKSPYPQYEALYADALTRLIAAAREVASGEDPGVADDPSFSVYGFGDPMRPSIGMRTIW